MISKLIHEVVSFILKLEFVCYLICYLFAEDYNQIEYNCLHILADVKLIQRMLFWNNNRFLKLQIIYLLEAF